MSYQNLEQKTIELQQQFNVLSDKIMRLREECVIETDVLNKFKLEKQIEKAETERVELEKQLEQAESSQKLETLEKQLEHAETARKKLKKQLKKAEAARKKLVKQLEQAKNSKETITKSIVPVDDIIKSTHRLDGEVFAAELLKKPIILKKTDKCIRVEIDRSDVDSVVITTKGKKELCDEMVTKKRYKLLAEEKYLQNFLIGKNDQENEYKFDFFGKYGIVLRWVSGGILSIVNYNEREWVPLFFRDIRPYGWNVALGSSERKFDDTGKVIVHLEQELNNPSECLQREFSEEAFVLRVVQFS